MSVLSQWNSLYNKKGHQSTVFFAINNYINHKIEVILSNNNIGNNDAKRLEKYFQNLKNAILNRSKPIDKQLYVDPFYDEFIQYIESNLNQDILNILFNYKGLLGNRTSGDKFENDIVNIINTAANNTNIAENLGMQMGTSNLLFTKNQLTGIYEKWLDVFNQNINTGIYELADKVSFKNYGFRGDSNSLYRLGEVQGKIDVKIAKTCIKFIATLDPSVQEFITLIQGHNITAKNYINLEKVSFGHTNKFRIYATVLPQLGFNSRQALKSYYIQQSIRSEHTRYALVHYVDEKLALYYEITGDGIQYDGQSMGIADLVVINERNGNTIKVYNAARLIQEKLQKIKNKYSNLNIN